MRTFLRFALSLACLAGLAACSPLPHGAPHGIDVERRIAALRPVDALLIGEQHDNPDHQRIQTLLIESLAANDRLSAVVIEMAERGRATTGLSTTASEDSVKSALHWNDKAWPWPRYAATVMAAVRAGVVVVGGNMPREQMRDAMTRDSWDTRLSANALRAQQALIQSGHCNLLAPTQIAPMTRIQIARDVAMADTLAKAAVLARNQGKAAVLIAGSVHVDKRLGVPQHLPKTVSTSTVLLSGQPAAAPAESTFDQVWHSAPAPEKDYCAELKAKMGVKTGE